MRFVRVRSGGSACRSDCPEWLSAEGKIVTGTADALGRVVAALGDRRLPIFINSAGGSVQDAMAMGRLVRAKHLVVVVAHTTVERCPASAKTCGEARGSAETLGAYCASACALVLAGGTERYVSPMSFVGVHQLTQVVSKTEVKRAYAVRYLALPWMKLELSRTFVGERRSIATVRRAADKDFDDSVGRYFDEMGVGDPVMKLMLRTPARDVHWLTPAELEASRLATIWLDGASPIVEGAGASGLGGEPVDARSDAASLFVATSASPLERSVAGAQAELDASFAYRRGGGTVLASLVARNSTGGNAVDLGGAGTFLILYPEGVEFRGAKIAAGSPMAVSIPVRSFCRMRAGGRAVVSFIELSRTPAAPDGAVPPRQPPVVIDPLAADGAKPLFDEACPLSTTASR